MKKHFFVMMILVSIFGVETLAQTITVTPKNADFYVCNAGLRHSDPGIQVCKLKSTGGQCTPGECAPGVADCDCVCTSLGGGNNRMDYFSGTACQVSDSGQCIHLDTFKTGAGTGQYSQVAGDGFSTLHIQNLSFGFGSELFGAEYFVDLCYAGILPTLPPDCTDCSIPAQDLTAIATVTDFAATPSGGYKSLSRLTTQAEVLCTSFGGAVASFSSGVPVALSGLSFKYFNIIPLSVENDPIQTCFLRMKFFETNIRQPRPHEKGGAQFSIYSNISDPQ